MNGPLPVVLGAALLSLLVAACTTSEKKKEESTSAAGLPAYTLQAESPADCAVENSDGSVTSADFSCHVHVVFDAAVTTNVVRMELTGTFHASYVFPLIFASNLTASDGWVFQFWRTGIAPSGMLNLDVCETESCSSDEFITFGGTYNPDDDFTLVVEVDRGMTPDTILAWADNTPAANPAGDYSSLTNGTLTSDMTGNLVGVSLQGATLRTATITASGGTFQIE